MKALTQLRAALLGRILLAVFIFTSVVPAGLEAQTGTSLEQATTPTGLTVNPEYTTTTLTYADGAILTWQNTNLEQAAVVVLRSDNGGAYQMVHVSATPTETTWSDSGLLASHSYGYEVAAAGAYTVTNGVYSFAWSSAASTPVTLPAVPPSPTSFVVASTSSSSLGLSWVLPTAPGGGPLTGVGLVGTVPLTGATRLAVSLPATATGYDDDGLAPATLYQYQLYAYNARGANVAAVLNANTSSPPDSPPDALGVTLGQTVMSGTSTAVTTNLAVLAGRSVNNSTSAVKDGEFMNYTGTGSYRFWFQRVHPVPVAALPDQVAWYYQSGANSFSTLGTLSGTTGTGYGTAIATVGNQLFISAPGALNSSGVASGIVYIYTVSVSATGSVSLAFNQSLEPPSQSGVAGDRFGYSLAVDGNRLIIGAPGRGVSGVAQAGQVFLFGNGGTWNWQQTKQSQSPQSGGQFGFSVALRGRNYVVGAPYEQGLFQVGSNLYLLGQTGDIYLGRWDQPGTMLGFANLFSLYGIVQANITGLSGSHFGYSVSIDSMMRIAVGMPDSSWQSVPSMAAWTQGAVMFLNWNGALDNSYDLTLSPWLPSGLSSGAQFGANVKTSTGGSGFDFGVGTGMLNSSTDAVSQFFFVDAVQVQASQATGLLVGLDPDLDPLTYSFAPQASGTNLSPFFTLDQVGHLAATASLSPISGTSGTLWPQGLGLTVSDGRGGALTQWLSLYVLSPGGSSVSSSGVIGTAPGSGAYWDPAMNPYGYVSGSTTLQNYMAANPYNSAQVVMTISITSPGSQQVF